MATTEQNGKFIKGITVTLGIVVSIQGAWAVYTQGNRFTYSDGQRLERKIERLEVRLDELVREHGKYDAGIHSH